MFEKGKSDNGENESRGRLKGRLEDPTVASDRLSNYANAKFAEFASARAGRRSDVSRNEIRTSLTVLLDLQLRRTFMGEKGGIMHVERTKILEIV